MIVFASTMAQMMDKQQWKALNLVSRTQWDNCGHSKGYDHRDPTEFIPARVRDHFQFSYWEQLYKAILASDPSCRSIFLLDTELKDCDNRSICSVEADRAYRPSTTSPRCHRGRKAHSTAKTLLGLHDCVFEAEGIRAGTPHVRFVLD